MKKSIKYFTVSALAVAALASCNKEIDNTVLGTTEVVRTVNFTTGPVTKTVFGEAVGTSVPTLWTPNQTVAISRNLNAFKQSSVPEVSEDGKKATFTAEFEASTGTFYAISPYAALPGTTLTNSKAITVEIAASQTPLENSVDEKAQILVAKKEVTSESISDVAFSFEHFTAYGKFGFSNLSLAEGEKVASVSLTAEENWAGRFYYYFENNTFEVNSAGKTISLTTDKTKDIWFACAPVDLGGTPLSVVVTTDKGTTYSRTVDIPKDKKFESGKINAFTINMSGIKADGAVEYELVTDASMLSVGSQVIIAASGDNYAISTTQNNNNRAQAAVTKSGSKIVSPGADVQIFEVERGVDSGTWAFKCVNGELQGKYIYAAGGSTPDNKNNYLRTQESNDATGSWSISVNPSGVATLKAGGDVVNNVLMYNQSNKLFSCYSSRQKDVSIYSVPDNRESVSLTFSQGSYELEVDSDEYKGFRPQTATINPSSLAGEIVYAISDDSGITSGFNTSNGSFTLTGNTGTATITASYAGNDNYRAAIASYTVKVYAAGTTPFASVEFAFSRNGSTNTITDNFKLTTESAKSATDYYQDKSGTEGLDLYFTKTNSNEALFTVAPTTITLKVKVGGGAKRDALENNVIAYLVDNKGNNIESTSTIVTTKVEEDTGKEYSVSMPLISEAYGLRIHHDKEKEYNIRIYGVYFLAE